MAQLFDGSTEFLLLDKHGRIKKKNQLILLKKYISNNVLNYFIGDIYLFTTLYRVISAFTMPVL